MAQEVAKISRSDLRNFISFHPHRLPSSPRFATFAKAFGGSVDDCLYHAAAELNPRHSRNAPLQASTTARNKWGYTAGEVFRRGSESNGKQTNYRRAI